jgi:hypothetical protein
MPCGDREPAELALGGVAAGAPRRQEATPGDSADEKCWRLWRRPTAAPRRRARRNPGCLVGTIRQPQSTTRQHSIRPRGAVHSSGLFSRALPPCQVNSRPDRRPRFPASGRLLFLQICRTPVLRIATLIITAPWRLSGLATRPSATTLHPNRPACSTATGVEPGLRRLSSGRKGAERGRSHITRFQNLVI